MKYLMPYPFAILWIQRVRKQIHSSLTSINQREIKKLDDPILKESH